MFKTRSEENTPFFKAAGTFNLVRTMAPGGAADTETESPATSSRKFRNMREPSTLSTAKSPAAPQAGGKSMSYNLVEDQLHSQLRLSWIAQAALQRAIEIEQ